MSPKIIYLECKTNGSNKFYEIKIIQQQQVFKVWTRWGKIGKKGQTKLNITLSYLTDAIEHTNDLRTSKIAKGYYEKIEETSKPIKELRPKTQEELRLERFIKILE